MDHGYLFVMAVNGGGWLVTLASPRSDIGTVAYEMAGLAEQIARAEGRR
jgi:predicted regulator of Ras-like GTPase activity (Roadblock/LC7/MglB family)